MTEKRLRARDYGWVAPSLLPCGERNAITDVSGVQVGHFTLIRGEAEALNPGKGPVRTGVTAVLPHKANLYTQPVEAAAYAFNGYGKSLGLVQIEETGIIETPVLLTNTFSVWDGANALLEWMLRHNPRIGIDTCGSLNPVVLECNDGYLNDIQGRHLRAEHFWHAIEHASAEETAEGNVGGGTGMRAYQFKGGIGTASRRLPAEAGGFTVGVLVQANFGLRKQLTIRGQPVGQWLSEWQPCVDTTEPEKGSCIIVIATDAPLDSRQLRRLAKRAPLGLARSGSVSGPGSGDIAIAFSTSRRSQVDGDAITQPLPALLDEWRTLGLLFQAVVEATDEAVLNSLVAAHSMAGRDRHYVPQIPISLVQSWLQPVLGYHPSTKE